MGCELIAIVWIVRPCVAHVAKLNYEVFECVTCKPPPFDAIKFLVASDAKLNYEVFKCVHV